jgi:cobalt/nickel transport system ATP-binding protein
MDKNSLIINLEDICFAYPGRAPTLDKLNLQFHQGDRIGLMGPNGCGKTSLLHVIMGLLKPSSGRIEIFGRTLNREKDFRMVRQRIGFLFQDADDQLFSPTVLEDVAFGPLNLGKSQEEAKTIARRTLESLDLAGFEDRITYKLSGGEKRLVSLATVMAMDPEVLLLDEPNTGLDETTEKRLVDILKRVDFSYILVSHNIDFLVETTNRVNYMADGKVSLDEDSIPHTHLHAHRHGRYAHKHSPSSPGKKSGG